MIVILYQSSVFDDIAQIVKASLDKKNISSYLARSSWLHPGCNVVASHSGATLNCTEYRLIGATLSFRTSDK